MTRSLILIILLCVSLVACQQKPAEYEDSFLAFGTIIDVTLVGVEEQKALQAMQDIRDELAYMHRVWHVWEPSPLKRINTLLETTAEFSAAPSVLDLIHEAKSLAATSEHLFNPAIGKLIALWGFHQNEQPDTIPPGDEIKKLLAQKPSMENISINGVRMRSNNAAVKIDLGGIAKGYAIERLLVGLQQKGIHNALINTGGDLKVIGQHNDRHWYIGIRHPRKKSALASIELKHNEAIFTSGDYERYLDTKSGQDYKKRFHHIIDPRTGYPATESQSVTVLHHNATVADAAATALFIAGPKDWLRIAKKMGVKHAMLVDKNGDIHITPTMKARVKFEQDHNLIISEAI